MKRISMLLALASVLLLLFAWPAMAAKPLLFGAVGANGAWLDGPDSAFPADVEAHGVLWAGATPHIDVGFNGDWGLTHSYLRGEGWAKVTATDENDPNFNIFLKVGYRGGSTSAVQPAEWGAGAGLGWVPKPDRFPRFIVTAEAVRGFGNKSRGLDPGKLIATFGGRYYFPISF